jgi:hypothetical protein
VAITPRTDGVYTGIEAGGHPVAVRYYANHDAYFAVARAGTPMGVLPGWLTKEYSSAHGNLTGPWTYDSTGAFNKPNSAGELNRFTTWKYNGDSFNLHVVSTFECHQPGTVREETIFMNFVADPKSKELSV